MARPEWSWLLLFLVSAALPFPSARAELPVEVNRALASRDYSSALNWLKAHAGDPEAEYELGRLYRLGKGVPKDEERALLHFHSAAEAGNPDAQYLLGKHYEKSGELTAADLWMRKAADGGHRKAGRWEVPRQEPAALNLPAMIRSNRLPSVAELSGFDVNEADAAGRTPVMLAAGRGASEWLALLLANGARVNDADHRGSTALHMAAIADEPTSVRLLLNSGADPDVANGEGNTALHLAVSAGATEVARMLAAAGADRDRLNTAGWSASALALRSRNLEMNEVFGQEVADAPEIAADADELPRLIADAAMRGDLVRLNELIANENFDPQAGSLERLPWILAEEGSIEVLERIVRAGVPISARDGRGRTALLVAAEAGCAGCIDVLVQRDAALEARDASDKTALLLAAKAGQGAAVRVLLEGGANPTAADAFKRNALWLAINGGAEALGLELLQAGIPLEADGEGWHPLHLAASADSRPLIRHMAGRVELDLPTSDGNTALLLAAHNGALAALSALIELSANVNYRNESGDTALIVAVRRSHLDAARLLLDAGANPDARNDRFESAVSIVEARDEIEWLELFDSADRGLLDLLGGR